MWFRDDKTLDVAKPRGGGCSLTWKNRSVSCSDQRPILVGTSESCPFRRFCRLGLEEPGVVTVMPASELNPSSALSAAWETCTVIFNFRTENTEDPERYHNETQLAEN